MTSFDDAVRAYFGAPPDASVSSSLQGVSDNDGCDTCGYGSTPASVEITVYISAVRKKNGRKAQFLCKEFTSMPELWDALHPTNTDTTTKDN